MSERLKKSITKIRALDILLNMQISGHATSCENAYLLDLYFQENDSDPMTLLLEGDDLVPKNEPGDLRPA